MNPNGISAVSGEFKKSVDSYWITELCLTEFPAFGAKYDQVTYEYFLRQIIMNWRRTRKRPVIIRKSVFVLTCNLMQKYFKNFHTNMTNYYDLECAILNQRFIQYELILIGIKAD